MKSWGGQRKGGEGTPWARGRCRGGPGPARRGRRRGGRGSGPTARRPTPRWAADPRPSDLGTMIGGGGVPPSGDGSMWHCAARLPAQAPAIGSRHGVQALCNPDGCCGRPQRSLCPHPHPPPLSPAPCCRPTSRCFLLARTNPRGGKLSDPVRPKMTQRFCDIVRYYSKIMRTA